MPSQSCCDSRFWIGGRFESKDVIGYIIAQVFGGLAGAAILYLIAMGKSGGGFAANGFVEASPERYSLTYTLITEVVMSFMPLTIILEPTYPKSPARFDGIAIGLALVLVHLVNIPVTNTSVNPARINSLAIFAGGINL